ncbi:MAG: ABC transporter ATP-binding protein/permease [Desulfobacteraceae bacterium]|nr:ABC transporter ATP-binding protein/permease [Desulfobacteraceae bacterium]
MILFIMILVTGVLEAVGVASVMPFLSVLSNPEVIQENAYLSLVYNSLGFTETNTFLFFLGIGVFLIVVFGLSFKALTEYFLARFTHMRNYSLSSRLLHSYLFMPYSWFLNRHSADLGKTILSEVQQVIQQALIPSAKVIAQGVIVLCLVGMLLLIDPVVALVAAGLLGGSYCGIYLVLRRFLSRIGADRVRANQERFQIAQEAFGGIKEVKAAGLEQGYFCSFLQPAKRFARHQAANMIAGQVPRFVLEALAFGGMLIVILILLYLRGGTLDQVLPTLGVFAFAGMRLLPAMQQVYQNATTLRFGTPALDALHKDMMQGSTNAVSNVSLSGSGNEVPLPLYELIELRDVSFTYPGASQPAIDNLNMNIDANTTVGLAGPTGAGKTTLVDLIMGLLPPDQGQILVDGKPIFPDNPSHIDNGLIKSWQLSLGYVPQQIFLADDSVSANIAFGAPEEEIDMAAVEKAAKIAELHNFVLQELPHEYETTVGERGVRLSGGQRQRIGIARSLYHDPDVLILDEATSALDNLTEKAVMDAVHNLARQKTIILIAHRLSTVQKCDQIFLLEHGRLIGRGTYDELLSTSHEFRKMAAVNE